MVLEVKNKINKYFVDPDKEHYLKFGLNPNGDFILLENYSSWGYKEFKWEVQIIINKNDFNKLDEEDVKYFENLKEDIHHNYKEFSETGFIGGLQMVVNEYSLVFFSDAFEEHLQVNKIDYIKLYNTNTSDYKNELGIHEVLEKIYATEDHQIHMGISPMGNMIFDEDYCNTTSYLQEPYENEEVEWSVKFIINKKIWDKLDKKTKNLILDYKEKTKKKYEDYYNDFPADAQMSYGGNKEFISNEYELSLQKLDIAYTKTIINHNRSAMADWI